MDRFLEVHRDAALEARLVDLKCRPVLHSCATNSGQHRAAFGRGSHVSFCIYEGSGKCGHPTAIATVPDALAQAGMAGRLHDRAPARVRRQVVASRLRLIRAYNPFSPCFPLPMALTGDGTGDMITPIGCNLRAPLYGSSGPQLLQHAFACSGVYSADDSSSFCAVLRKRPELMYQGSLWACGPISISLCRIVRV